MAIQQDEAGIASGILNTSQQIGGALGTAILSTVAFTAATNYVTDHSSSDFGPAAAAAARLRPRARLLARVPGRCPISAIGFALTLVFIPRGDAPEYALTEGEAEPEPAAV